MRKAISISMVKNEADIIESFVRYHINIFDRMIILDNGSTDRTLSILNLLKAEGLPIDIIMDNFEYLQAEKTTSLLYDAFKQYSPDIIFPLDADEFLISTDQREHPKKIMEELDLDTVYYLQLMNYAPSPHDNLQELFIPKRMIHSCGLINPCKVAIPKGIMENYSPSVTKGNHDLTFKKNSSQIKKQKPYGALRLAHYQIRSIEQMKSKVLLGWLNNLATYNRIQGNSHHLKKWFKMIRENDSVQPHDLLGTPKLLAPINLSFCKSTDIKYTSANEVDSFQNLLSFCEALAVEYANVRRILVKLKGK